MDPGVALVAAMVQWYIGLATLRMLRRSRVRVRVRNWWAKNTCPHQAPMSRRAHVGGLPWHYCHMHVRNVWIQAGCQTGDWVVRVATCAQEPVVARTCRLPSPPQAHYYYYYYYYMSFIFPMKAVVFIGHFSNMGNTIVIIHPCMDIYIVRSHCGEHKPRRTL